MKNVVQPVSVKFNLCSTFPQKMCNIKSCCAVQ